MTTETQESAYVDSYVVFLDILGFSKLTELADADPKWRVGLMDAIHSLRGTLPLEIPYNGFRATQFSDCIVISAKRSDQALFTVMMAANMLATNLFHLGIILRGGMARGNFQHDNQLMFGPALVRAHSFDRRGAPPDVAIDDEIIADIANSEHRMALEQWVRPDPWDLTPMLHTLHRFEFYPQRGDTSSRKDAKLYSAAIGRHASDMRVPADVRAKWRWMQDYWNRTVSVKGILDRSV